MSLYRFFTRPRVFPSFESFRTVSVSESRSNHQVRLRPNQEAISIVIKGPLFHILPLITKLQSPLSPNLIQQQKERKLKNPLFFLSFSLRRENAVKGRTPLLHHVSSNIESHVTSKMALQQLSLSPSTDGRQLDGSKAARLPRWTRQEILVLIQGKRVTESRVRTAPGFGSGQIEPKWVSVSSYCKRHGVNRGPVQCRKRWSNLAGDFKKIKEWEMSRKRDETESFWVMRNDLRREKKLPGFFDREVFDILDGGGSTAVEEDPAAAHGASLALALVPHHDDEERAEEEEEEVLFDSGRTAVDDGLFSDSEQTPQGSGKDVPAPVPISVAEKQYESLPKETPGKGINHEKQPVPEADVRNVQEGKKRKRSATNGEGESANLEHLLLNALEKNGQRLSSQLEAQNTHLQLDREQRKDHTNSLIGVLNKLADALGRIADKL